MVKLLKAVFLDRDGVINRPIIKKGISYAPTKLKDFRLFPKVKSSIKNLKKKATRFLWSQINQMFQEVKLRKKQ